MNARLTLFRACPRRFVRRGLLRALNAATAAAMGRSPAPVAGLGFRERLRAYAAFTASAAHEALEREGDIAGVRTRLRARAHRLGRSLRDRLHLSDMGEAMAAARVAYGAIGIDFVGDEQGRITVRSCYFSRFYSPEVCGLVSALDEGLLAGLAGDGRLAFEQRITEGAECCRASFCALGART